LKELLKEFYPFSKNKIDLIVMGLMDFLESKKYLLDQTLKIVRLSNVPVQLLKKNTTKFALPILFSLQIFKRNKKPFKK
jgi:hypothetical protein